MTLFPYDKLTIFQINNFSIKLLKRTLLNRFWWPSLRILTVVAFFSIKSSDCFKKKLMIGAEDIIMQLWFRICIYIKPSLMYRLSDHWWFNILYERYVEFKILRIWDENANFINSIFSENGQRLKIDSIYFIEHLSVLVLDMVWTEDIFHHLNLQLL